VSRKKNQYNADCKQHGYWVIYWFNGKLRYKGNYVNGEKHGYWQRYYYSNGKLKSKNYYL
jgi:antitoxin component YwqK of YwqJK toxin-antitoxin module